MQGIVMYLILETPSFSVYFNSTCLFLIFVIMKDNKLVMPFGKYKGKELSEVPNGYLLYLYDRHFLTGWLKEYAENNIQVLKYRTLKYNTETKSK